jgi:hypothetical protein
MKRFPKRFFYVTPLIFFFLLSPVFTGSSPAVTCDDCLSQCDFEYENDYTQCTGSYDRCNLFCWYVPTPNCEALCDALKERCLQAAETTLADCTAQCQWYPCCENNPCDDGLACNGLESCAPEYGQCRAGEPLVCESDQLFCNGVEACDEDIDQCASPGDPCESGETCDEQTDLCLPHGDDDNDNNDDNATDDKTPSDDDNDDGNDDDNDDAETDDDAPDDDDNDDDLCCG